MFLLSKYRNINCRISAINYIISKKEICTTKCLLNKQKIAILRKNVKERVVKDMEKFEFRVMYNSVIENSKLKHGYHRNSATLNKILQEEKKIREELRRQPPISLFVQKLMQEGNLKENEDKANVKLEKPANNTRAVHFPFEAGTVDVDDDLNISETTTSNLVEDERKDLFKEVKLRNEAAEWETWEWMTAYDNYIEEEQKIVLEKDRTPKVYYGTPDPNSKISDVPCGGCGAHLHCKDPAIPGYIPHEIFKNHGREGCTTLGATLCQRCYFLKEYNMALKVRVSPEDYPKILHAVSKRRGLVLLMVDLLDFPCSIWPGIGEIFGRHTPVVVVGNKVDLLPQDDKKYLTRIKENLLETVKFTGFTTFDIRHTALISAKTGYGIEDLISMLQSIWKFQGDVFIVGSTNVGKSTLFNRLLESDYCKSKAVDLIQRATTSQWPGTTLNLLKFPLLRPSGARLHERFVRLMQEKKIESLERKERQDQLRETRDPEYASLTGRVGRTFRYFGQNVDFDMYDPFHCRDDQDFSGITHMGIDEHSPEYVDSRWCFDTPGVVMQDHILHLLTAEELAVTMPRRLIMPRSFCIKPGTSLFIAGLARVDYLEGDTSIKITVFSSNDLPITLCETKEADALYKELLESELLKVPVNDPERLSTWPGLELAETFTVIGVDHETSCKDIVLSNAGWVAITGGKEKKYKLQAWTPEQRGVHLRDCLLPKAVALRGARIRNSPAYRKYKFYLV